MHCFASENQTYTGTVIFGVESVKVFKRSTKPTAEKSTTENPRKVTVLLKAISLVL